MPFSLSHNTMRSINTTTHKNTKSINTKIERKYIWFKLQILPHPLCQYWCIFPVTQNYEKFQRNNWKQIHIPTHSVQERSDDWFFIKTKQFLSQCKITDCRDGTLFRRRRDNIFSLEIPLNLLSNRHERGQKHLMFMQGRPCDQHVQLKFV